MRNEGLGSWPARRARKTPHRTALVYGDGGLSTIGSESSTVGSESSTVGGESSTVGGGPSAGHSSSTMAAWWIVGGTWRFVDSRPRFVGGTW